MAIEIIGLGELLDVESEVSEQEVQTLLNTFETKPDFQTGDQHDVEHFLKTKAIQFQKLGLSATHLIFSSYQHRNVLVGYVSIANKPLVVDSRTYSNLSKSMQKRFNNIGHRYQDSDGKFNKSDLIVPAFLIGQIGKNFSNEALRTKAINGHNMIAIAEEKIHEVVSLINGKFSWLECKPEEKLINLYERAGYAQIKDYISPNGLCIMVKKIK